MHIDHDHVSGGHHHHDHHDHEHCHHDHDHHHCGSCGCQCEHTPLEELQALIQYMVNHNAAHARELAQLAAVRSAIDNTGKVILNDHIRHCMVDAVQLGDESAIDGLCEAVEKFMK